MYVDEQWGGEKNGQVGGSISRQEGKELGK